MIPRVQLPKPGKWNACEGENMRRSRMDPECVELCNAVNAISPRSMVTAGSCWGHGIRPMEIDLRVTGQASLYVLGIVLSGRYYGRPGFRCVVDGDDLLNVVYTLESLGRGESAYRAASKLAADIVDATKEVRRWRRLERERAPRARGTR